MNFTICKLYSSKGFPLRTLMGNLLQTCLISSISLSILSLPSYHLSFVQVCLCVQTIPFYKDIVQWERIPLPIQEMQETQVWSLGQEDALEEEMQYTPVFFPEKFQGQRSLVGYSPCSYKESDTTEWLSMHTYSRKAVKKKICASNKVCLRKWCIRERNMRKPTAVFLVSATGRKSSSVLYSKMRWGGGNFSFGCVKCESLTTHPSRDSN